LPYITLIIFLSVIFLSFFFPDRDDRDFKAATGMPRSSQRINHEETKGTKVFSDLSSHSSFLFALFVSSWLILILSERRALRHA